MFGVVARVFRLGEIPETPCLLNFLDRQWLHRYFVRG